MKQVFKILAFSLVAVVMFSCGGKDKLQDDPRTQTLVVAMSSDAISFDPSAQNDSYSSNAMRQMYEGLVTLDANSNAMPALAERFEASPDGMSYTFYLKKGVKFHNGEELKASDVVFSYKRAVTAPAVAHIYSAIDAESIKALDDYTVTLNMKVPYAGILTALAHPAAFIVNQKAVETAGESYARQPVGTGPFKFVSHTKSNNIKMERFDDFHGDKPYYKYLEMRIIPEPANRIIELESGGADVVLDISPNDLSRFEGNDQIKLLKVDDFMTQYMGMNCSKPPLNDIRVRQAVACSVDTDQIVKAVWKGLGGTATAPYAPSLKYSIAKEKTPIVRDVEKAKKLLAEAGYPNGIKLRLSTNERQERIDMATIMKEQMKEAGIELSIEVMEWSQYIAMLESGGQEIFEIGWSSDTPDPDMVVYPCFHSNSVGPGGNFVFIKDAKLDKMIEDGRKIADGPEREQLYKYLQEYILDLTVAVFQYNGETAAGIQANLTGLNLSPLGSHFFGNIKPRE